MGVVSAVFVFVLYLRTLAPTVLYYDRPILLDSVMLQTQAYVLGITGPTGEPTWVMLTHLFTYLPLGDPGFRTNLSSAVYAALAVFAVFVAGLLLSRRFLAAAVGALAFGLGGTFWSQAIITEIYTLNALLIPLPIISLLLWREHRRDRYLLLAAFLMGFVLTNHLTSGLVIPAGFLFVALVERRKLVEWRPVLKGAGLFLLALASYLYLPLRASMDPPMNEADPTSPARLLEFLTGGELLSVLFAFKPSELPDRLELYADYLFADFSWVLVLVGILGLAMLLLRDRAAAVLLGFPFFGWLFYALEYNIYDFQLYFIPTYLMLALFMAAGAGALLQVVESMFWRFSAGTRTAVPVAVSGALLALPLLGAPAAYAANDRSDDYRGARIIETVAENAEPNSTILHHRSCLWYMVLVEERRRDLRIIDPWYPSWTRYTDIVWPEDLDAAATERRYGVSDDTGVNAARVAAEDGPVYILDQEGNGFHHFYDAGFRTLRVEGVLYRLIPPGEDIPEGSEGSVVDVREE